MNKTILMIALPCGLVLLPSTVGFGEELFMDDNNAVITGAWQFSDAGSGYQGLGYHTILGQGVPQSGQIVDNTQAQIVGSWNSSTTNPGFYGSDYLYSQAGDGSDAVIYDYTGLVSGSYHIYARWSSGSSRGKATYIIEHAYGSTAILTNQRYQGGAWYLLGTFADPTEVILTDSAAGGLIVADAVLAVPVGDDQALYMDDLQASLQGDWTQSQSVSGYYQAGYHYSEDGTAVYSQTAPQSGDYHVFARWTAAEDRTAGARYTIQHDQGFSTIIKNQRTQGGKWHLLGTFSFTAGQPARVELSNDTLQDIVVADSIKLLPAANSATLAWQQPITRSGIYKVQADWVALSGNASDANYVIDHAGGSTPVTVNQKGNHGTWVTLGEFYYNAGDTAQITLSDLGNGQLVGDAVRMTANLPFYLKPGSPGSYDIFGYDMAIAGDLMVVSASHDDSSSMGNMCNHGGFSGNSGAVYVFRDPDGDGDFGDAVQEACLKAVNADPYDLFGRSVATDGSRIVVGAAGEDSDGSSSADNSASESGAVYVFAHDGTSWVQEAYLKASNAGAGDWFGWSMDFDGSRIVVGAYREASDGSGPSDDSAPYAGAAYIFAHDGTAWVQEAYLKADNADPDDRFGESVAIDGGYVAVGALGEDGDGSSPADNSASSSGAVYAFAYDGSTWVQEAYLKANSVDPDDSFGNNVAMDGSRIVIGVPGEDSDGSSAADNSSTDAGALYVFARDGAGWVQEAYLKSNNLGAGDSFGGDVTFGRGVAISGDRLVVGAHLEDGDGSALSDNSLYNAGSVYVFSYDGSDWVQEAYLKASNAEQHDWFGRTVAIDGASVAVGAPSESGNGTSPTDNSLPQAGAVYTFLLED